MPYRQHEQPGCGGCLLLLMMIAFLMGGLPMLSQLLGFIALTVFFIIFSAIAAFWGFSYYIKRKISAYEQSQTATHNTFVHLLIHILVHIARIDNQVTKAEIEIIHRFFRNNLRYDQNQMYWVKELVREALSSTTSLNDLLAEFRQNFAYEPRLILLELIFQVLYTKSRVPESELAVAREIAGFLGISAYDFRVIENKFRGGYGPAMSGAAGDGHYYKILGLEEGVSFEEIKSAYRKLSMQYHPDKVSHLGEEFRAVAEEKMKEINGAYQHLQTKFGKK